MVGKQQNPAKQQLENLDQSSKDILNDLLDSDVEEMDWPAGKEPKFYNKSGLKYLQVLYDTNLKKYVCNDKNVPVLENKVIKIDLVDSELYYCFCPEEEEYIRIKTPKDMTAKYTTLTTTAHMMQGWDITVSVLLSFTAQAATVATKALRNVIREILSDEVLKQKILNHSCYMDLI